MKKLQQELALAQNISMVERQVQENTALAQLGPMGDQEPTQMVLGSASASRIVQRGEPALYRLLEGYEFALELRQNIWDFAVEIGHLNELGLTNNQLRWLVCAGLAEHAREILPAGRENRAFQPPAGRLTLHRRTCFVLTKPGASFVRSMIEARPVPQEKASDPEYATDVASPLVSRTPYWDADRQELRLGYVVVKRFRVPAPNQVMILAAFQEEGWPARVDDPLPPRCATDPKRRLHDTVNSLNRSQRNRLVSFQGDGSGRGVCWTLA